jgi:antitoxin component of RelBE/YafQ-DinJ toxin-antitoxin module
MATLTIHDFDPELKSEALKIMKQHGMTAKDTVSAFFQKIISDHRHDVDNCFCVNLELNDETMRDLENARSGKVAYTECKNTDDLFQRLGI